MKFFKITTAGSIPIALVALLSSAAIAQQAAERNRPSKPRATAISSTQSKPVRVGFLQSPGVEQKCLRALNGACTNNNSIEAARLRANVIPAVRVSYLGTPAGTVGGKHITFERLFQDNAFLYGLPTFTFVQPCCTSRTK